MYQRRCSDVKTTKGEMDNDKRISSATITNERRLFDVRGEKDARSHCKRKNGDVSKMSVYRPTVRYAPVFRNYVDAVFHATTLDRNQIIRAALFTAAHTKEFQMLLRQYQKKTSLSPPLVGR